MYLYIIFGLISLLSFSEMNLGRKFGKIAAIPIILVFYLLSFLRWERGTDWSAYKFIFENMASNEYLQMMYEFLFIKLNSFVYSATGDFSVLLFVEASIIFFCFFYIIRKYSEAPILSVLVWFSVSLASIFFTRQAIAVAICVLALNFIIQRKLYLFLLTVFIAMLFHKSALIFFPAYWIYNLNLSKKQIIVILISSFVLTSVASSLLTTIGNSSLGALSERSSAYMESGADESFGSGYSPMETMIRGVSYRLFLIGIFIIFLFKNYEKVQFRGIFNLYLMSVVLFILFVPISVALIRFSGYYEIFQIFLYPILILQTKNKIIKNLLLLLLIVYLGFKFYGVIFAYKDLYIPYKSIFNKEFPVKVG
ncbi:EpsG family protein [Chryseobacterium polytrichastri]|uniref:EpsG family protein n=1 Tax=Chryseobacterium polytrichastri TaxID=1302687 RepID=A0A1M6U420_9FLAO|nr:EpsG family protein [Chryseobacterium polytrichastri]SHK64035.1 EpsG family protein [Chryseobacterium polytrichastri]